MFRFLRVALPGQSAKQALESEHDGPGTPIYDAPDVECPSSNGLVNRSSSRSSSPVVSKNVEAYRLPVSPRASEKLLAHGSSSSSRSNLSSTAGYPPGRQAASRGRRRHLLLLVVLLLPAVTGLTVMCIRLRSSETEHALILPPSATAYAWRGPNDERRTIHNVQYAEDDADEEDTAMRPQSYARMRYRNRDRLPKWAKRAVKAAKAFFAVDPVATYLLREGPMTWYWNWLTKRKWWPAPLWDRHALVPGAPFLWGSPGQLCSILNATADVALVGNGPLTSEQRQAINQAGSVVRINALNNRLPGDKIDIWLCRYNGLGPANFWGFKQLSYREAEEVVGASQGVVFLGGHPTKLMAYAVEELLTWYPFVPVEKSMQINITGYWDLYNRVLSDRTTLQKAGAMPSSGLLAALATAPCMRPGQKLHVYGFNWNPQAWFMHKMDSEQKIIKRLFRGLDVTIHPTACDGMYTCHKLCDGLFYRIAKDGDKAVCEAKAIEDQKKKTQEALAKKQRRSAAMQAMLDSPGHSGLEAPVDVTQEVPAWVMDGGIRPVTRAAQIESWGALGEKGDAADVLMAGRKGIKYSKADVVDNVSFAEQGLRLGKAEGVETDDVLQPAALEELADAAEDKAAEDVQEVDEEVAEVATSFDEADEDMESQEEGEQSAEPEEGPDVDAPLTEEAAYPARAQKGTQAAATKRSAADAAAQEGVDDMLEEQDRESEADEAPEEAADDAEENLDDAGAESASKFRKDKYEIVRWAERIPG